MWPLRTIAYFIMFWSGCAMAIVNPIYGVMTYMLVYQANPTVTWWGLPLVKIGMRFSLFAAGATILGLIFGRRRVPDVRDGFSVWEMSIVGLVLIAALNLVLGIGIYPSTSQAMDKFWKIILFVLILTRLASTRKNLRLVIWSLVAGSMYIGYDAYTAPPDAFLMGRLERIGGPDFSTTSGAAAHLVAMLPIIGGAYLIAPNWRYRVFAAVTGALTFNAVILCRTRSAFLGLCFGILTAILFAPRIKRFRIYLLLALGALAAFSLTDGNFWIRMNTLTSREGLQTDSAARSRQEIWQAAYEMLSDYPLGVGPGNFTQKIGDYNPVHRWRASHNSVVACFTELGVQGGVLFLFIMAGSVRQLQRAAKLARYCDHPTETAVLAYALFASFVTYAVTALGTQRLYCESFWWVMALPLCLHRATAREVYKTEEEPRLAQSANDQLRTVPFDGYGSRPYAW